MAPAFISVTAGRARPPLRRPVPSRAVEAHAVHALPTVCFSQQPLGGRGFGQRWRRRLGHWRHEWQRRRERGHGCGRNGHRGDRWRHSWKRSHRRHGQRRCSGVGRHGRSEHGRHGGTPLVGCASLNPAAKAHADHCYLLVTSAVSWDNAKNACMSLGGHLVTLSSSSPLTQSEFDAESKFVFEELGG